MVGGTKSSDWSGTNQSGLGVLASFQTERFDWTGERSVLIGRAPTNHDTEFLNDCRKEPFDWSGEQSVLMGQGLAWGDAGLPS